MYPPPLTSCSIIILEIIYLFEFLTAFDVIQNTIANRYIVNDVNKFYQALDKDTDQLTKDVEVLEGDNTQIQIDRVGNFLLDNLGISIPITTLLTIIVIIMLIVAVFWYRKKARQRQHRYDRNSAISIELQTL